MAERIKTLRLEQGLSLRYMVLTHGYHDSNYRRIEREGAGGIQSLLRICKAFNITLSCLLDGLGLYPKEDLKEIGEGVAANEHAAATKSKASK